MIKGKINSKDRDTGEIGQEIKILADEAREITVEQAEAYQPRGKSVKVPSVRKSKNTKSTETIKNNKIEERLYLRLRDSSNQTQLTKLKNIIDKNQGKTDVVLVIGNSTDKQIIKLPTGIAMNLDVVKELRELVGSENIVTQ